MFVFVDDSGDPGLNVDKGVSPYLVITLVVFGDNDGMEVVDRAISKLRNELRLHPRFEFKFNRCSKERRLQFLDAVARTCRFAYCSSVVRKNHKLLHQLDLGRKESFYLHSIALAFRHADSILEDAVVLIDGAGSRVFRRQLQTYLKQLVNDPRASVVRKVRMRDSSRDNLLQLADMVGGAVYHTFGNKGDADVYEKRISNKRIFVRVWPN